MVLERRPSPQSRPGLPPQTPEPRESGAPDRRTRSPPPPRSRSLRRNANLPLKPFPEPFQAQPHGLRHRADPHHRRSLPKLPQRKPHRRMKSPTHPSQPQLVLPHLQPPLRAAGLGWPAGRRTRAYLPPSRNTTPATSFSSALSMISNRVPIPETTLPGSKSTRSPT